MQGGAGTTSPSSLPPGRLREAAIAVPHEVWLVDNASSDGTADAVAAEFPEVKLIRNAENVGFALEVIGRPRHVVGKQVPAILELVGLGDKMLKFPDELSGGEQQRVSIARAFVNRPLILLADEPTGNLDPETSVGIMRLLDRINRTGTTVVMATHDSSIVDQMRKRVIELENGHVVRDQAQGVYGHQS